MATHALSTPAPLALRPANDNADSPTGTPCRWHMAIETFRHWCPSVSLYFVRAKLRGAEFEPTCEAVIAALQAQR